MTEKLLAAELARILPHAEYVEMPCRKREPKLTAKENATVSDDGRKSVYGGTVNQKENIL